MQQLAREFDFSETTFVLPPSDPSCTCRVRIFTPRQELLFAGHPTLGTAAVLARRNGAQAARQFVFEEGIGPVTVTVDGPEISLHLRSPRYQTSDEAPPAAAVAKALTLPQDAITECWYAGIGLRFCFVRLADRDLVDRAVLDKGAWAAGIAGSWSPELYLFAGDIGHRNGTAPTVSRSIRAWPWGARAPWRASRTNRTAGSPRSSSAAMPRSSATAP
jgi:trans-2,3-dihydro-3-hydroxyanthranilate isomerase